MELLLVLAHLKIEHLFLNPFSLSLAKIKELQMFLKLSDCMIHKSVILYLKMFNF